jgi:hypothetical protein
MRRLPYLAGWLASLILVPTLHAEQPPDPLRLLPPETDLFLKLEQPRKLFESITQHPLFKQLQALDAVREAYDSTNARRFYQLLAYFEKQLGAGREELLDRLAGGGAVLGIKIGQEQGPVLLVVQGRDEQLMQRFFKLGLDLLEQELARQEAKTVLQRDRYRGLEVVHAGKEFHAALAGSALVMSNVDKGVQKALDLHLDGGKKSLAALPTVAEGHKLVGSEARLWLWLNLETVRGFPQAKEVFASPRNNGQLTVLFGGILDIAGRAPFLGAGLYAKPSEFALSFRMPRGREGMPTEIVTHVPPPGQAGSRPVLEPKGVLYSSSYYLDISKFWEYRAKLFNKEVRQSFEDLDKKATPFLAGGQLNKLLAQVGPYQRVVAVLQSHSGYKVSPKQLIPAFAVVLEMREPESFSKRIDAIARAGALLATTQVKLKLVEEKHGPYKLVGYRFAEDAAFKPDTTNFRFNFSPCFVAVGNQFAVCSTLELGREMVDLLDHEAKTGPAALGSPATACTQLYARGGTELLEAFKDRLFTQVMLDQPLPPERASQQVQTFLDWVRRLGILQLESNYGERDFRYDVRLKFAAAKNHD